jgi:hypothetical protein
MSGDESESMRPSGASGEVPGEAPAQKAVTPRPMRTLTLATVGIMAMGVDALVAFAHTGSERGQQMEAGAQKLVERYQENAKVQASAAGASRRDLAKQASITLDENLKAMWRVIVLSRAQEPAAEAPTDSAEPASQGECSSAKR